MAPSAAARFASAARVCGEPPMPVATGRSAARTVRSCAWAANGATPGAGVTRPSARTWAGPVPAFAPQRYGTGSACSRTRKPGGAAARTAATASSWRVRAVSRRQARAASASRVGTRGGPRRREGHGPGRTMRGSRPGPGSTRATHDAHGRSDDTFRSRSPRSAERDNCPQSATGSRPGPGPGARSAAQGPRGRLAEPGTVLGGEPSRVREPPPPGHVADAQPVRVTRPQLLAHPVQADLPYVRHG